MTNSLSQWLPFGCLTTATKCATERGDSKAGDTFPQMYNVTVTLTMSPMKLFPFCCISCNRLAMNQAGAFTLIPSSSGEQNMVVNVSCCSFCYLGWNPCHFSIRKKFLIPSELGGE